MRHLEPSYNFSYKAEELQKKKPFRLQDEAFGGGTHMRLPIRSWQMQQLLV